MVAKKAVAKKAPAKAAASRSDSGLAAKVKVLETAVAQLSRGQIEAAQDTLGTRA